MWIFNSRTKQVKSRVHADWSLMCCCWWQTGAVFFVLHIIIYVAASVKKHSTVIYLIWKEIWSFICHLFLMSPPPEHQPPPARELPPAVVPHVVVNICKCNCYTNIKKRHHIWQIISICYGMDSDGRDTAEQSGSWCSWMIWLEKTNGFF